MKDSNLTESEVEMLEECQTAMEWTIACDTIKETRDGNYPDDWWPEVKLTGMMDRIMARWDSNSDLTMTAFKG